MPHLPFTRPESQTSPVGSAFGISDPPLTLQPARHGPACGSATVGAVQAKLDDFHVASTSPCSAHYRTGLRTIHDESLLSPARRCRTMRVTHPTLGQPTTLATVFGRRMTRAAVRALPHPVSFFNGQARAAKVACINRYFRRFAASQSRCRPGTVWLMGRGRRRL